MDVTGNFQGAKAAQAVGTSAKIVAVLSVIAVGIFIYANWYSARLTKLEITKLEKELGITPTVLDL